jgi:6-phosphogluconolactonase (cycloisomerase 2 family)
MLAACGGGGGDGSTAALPADTSTTAPPPDNVAGFAYVGNQGTNNVSAYTINATTGALSEVAGSPFAAGAGPTSVSVHPSGKFAYAANFGSGIVSGSVSAYAIDAGTGALSEITGSPFAAETLTTDVAVDPSGRFAYVVNIFPGNISAYAIDAATGALSRVGAAVAAGFNPNAIAIDPSGRFAYVANFEGDFVSNVFAYTIDAGTGALSEVAGSPYPAGSDPHAVTVDPSGRFVYVASGQSANISAYAIDTGTGALSAISGSPFAGGAQLAVHHTGKFAYAGGANGILAYTINSTTGALIGIGAFAAEASPYRVTVDPSGRFAYAANRSRNDISAYSIDPTTGALTNIGAAVAAGIRPEAITTTRKIR